MADYLLDTNHASPLVTLHHPLRHRVLAAIRTVPVLTETLYGISIAPRGPQNLAIWAQLEPQLACHVPDAADARQTAELQLLLRRRGRQLATVDALIAIIALRYDLSLLSTDNDFDPVPSLRRENWR